MQTKSKRPPLKDCFEMAATLGSFFKPHVTARIYQAVKIAGHSPKLTMKCSYEEELPVVGGLMFELSVRLDEEWDMRTMMRIAEALEYYDAIDEVDAGCRINVQGYNCMIGDGDDPGAVTFRDGMFRIWVRGWK